MILQIPRLNVTSHIKMIVFVGWAAYGILPTMHWAITMGGFQNTMVAVSFIMFFFCLYLTLSNRKATIRKHTEVLFFFLPTSYKKLK